MAGKTPKKKAAKKAVKKTTEAKPKKTVKNIVKKKKASETKTAAKKKAVLKKKNLPKKTRIKNVTEKPAASGTRAAETEESTVVAAKYYPAQASGKDEKEQLKHFKDDKRKEEGLTDRYYDNKLTLMARDPYWCYAYWDISPDFMNERGKQALGKDYKLVLRVYDVTDLRFNGSNAHKYIDISVSGDANNWYINVWAAGRTYIADLGFLTSEGEFILVARSNVMSTPSDKVSDITDEEWMEVDEDFDEILRVSTGSSRTGSSDIVRGEIDMGSDIVSSFSSSELVRTKGFFLVADTELILYGATEKDARLKVRGEKINLNPDGSFSLRFHLSDGLMGLPVEAVSKDGKDKITIKINVERKTE